MKIVKNEHSLITWLSKASYLIILVVHGILMILIFPAVQATPFGGYYLNGIHPIYSVSQREHPNYQNRIGSSIALSAIERAAPLAFSIPTPCDRSMAPGLWLKDQMR
jgi:hypothetical protein